LDLQQVISIGGGAHNAAGTATRKHPLGMPVSVTRETGASFRAAHPALHVGPP
jgi:sugar (pentulose or hexulose) kinase